MKAIVVDAFCPFDQAELRQVADPEPGPGEVVIDVRAAEVNYPDILVIEGRYQVKPPLPFSPGKSAAGVISALGAGVTGFAPGDRVAAQVEYGAYAEKLRAPAVSCFPMPDSLTFEKGAALGLTYQSAYFALRERAQMRPGETVLVLGAAGGIGVATVQLAKAFGAAPVIAGVRGAENAALAGQVGADHVVDLGMDDLRDRLRDAVRGFTGGAGADIVVDPVGGAVTGAALRALAWRGRLVVIGFASGEIASVPTNYILVKNIAVTGLQWSDYRDREPDRVHEAQAELYALYVAGRIDPLVTRTYPLAEYAQALGRLRDGKARGKIVLKVAG